MLLIGDFYICCSHFHTVASGLAYQCNFCLIEMSMPDILRCHVKRSLSINIIKKDYFQYLHSVTRTLFLWYFFQYNRLHDSLIGCVFRKLGYFYSAAPFVLVISLLFPLRGPTAEFSIMNTVSNQKSVLGTKAR